MTYLLGLLIIMFTASDVFALDLSLGPGVSVKNAMLNLIALVLIIRIVLRRSFKLEVPTIVFSFAAMFIYALISIFVASMVIEYPHYKLTGSAISLKQEALDPALMLLTFFYGTRTFNEAKVLTKLLLGAFTFASIITVTNVYGLTHVGNIIYGYNNLYEANRVYGFFGHANETGVLIVLLLPAYVAVAMTSRGVIRFAWISAMMISVVVLIMTGSRGAIAGMALGGLIAAFMCRKYLTPARLLQGALVLALIGLPIIAVLGAKYGGEMVHRIISQATSADADDVSSGRLGLWATAIGRMMETPISLISGFGWNVYDSMGFKLIPHNHYIMLWFELGLVGLGAYLLVMRTLIHNAMVGLKTATPEMRCYLVGFVYSLMILSTAIIFEQLFEPWLYIWPYAGLTLRIAVLARNLSPAADSIALPVATGGERPALRPRVATLN
jgi:O-antigen ligase